MSAKYVFRLDDITENMHWENYFRIKQIFTEYKVKPLIGIIPDNKDPDLLKFPKCSFDFWEEIKMLKNVEGWSIALHGYNHIFETTNSGVLGINNRSEFAGLTKERQYEKIKNGKEILRYHGLTADAFMAPAHSFDKVTIECLKDNDINVITDGYSLYPYYESGVLFVPQLFSRPRRMPFGIYTWCLHLNLMTKEDIDELERFIYNNNSNIISFTEASSYVNDGKLSKLQNIILKKTTNTLRKVRAIIK